MNKLEVLYKVFNNIKEKESFEGVVNAQAFNGSEEIVNMRNEFSKDIKNGECKLIVNGTVNLAEFKGEIKESFDLNREEMHKKMHEKMGKHHMMGFDKEEFMNMDEKDKEEFFKKIKESFDLNREEMHKKMHEKMGKHHMMGFDKEEFMNMDEKDKEEFFKKIKKNHMRCHGMGRMGKNPMKKFGKAAFMLKVLNEMELSEDGDFKIIKLDLNEVKKEMKELKEEDKGKHFHCKHKYNQKSIDELEGIFKLFKIIKLDLNEVKKEMKELKEEDKGKHFHCKHKYNQKSIDELEGIFKLMAIKHKMRKEILFADYDEMTLNLYINKEFNIEKAFIEGKGEKTVNIEVNFR